MTAACRHYPLCGGCQILELDYAAQLRLKEAEVRRHFSAWPGLILHPAVPSPEVAGYRHKVQLPFGMGRGMGRGLGLDPGSGGPERPASGEPGAVTLGCYAAGSHTVVDQAECLVQEPSLSRAAWAVRDWAKAHAVPIYREEDGTGWLRHLLLRRGAMTGEVLLALVTNGSGAPSPERLDDLVARCRAALAAGPEGSTLAGVVQDNNPARTNAVLGHDERLLWGRAHLEETLGPFAFEVGVSTFFQVNPRQTPHLYDLAVDALPAGLPTLDLYCGIGTLTLWASRRASEVVGIEENPAAVAAARKAASSNRVGNVSFLAGDASEALSTLAAEASRPGGRRFAGALVDPPRKGLDPSVRSSLSRLGLRRLVYVSCYPATLARDAKALGPRFKLISITPVDMFPHTKHIECVAVFDVV